MGKTTEKGQGACADIAADGKQVNDLPKMNFEPDFPPRKAPMTVARDEPAPEVAADDLPGGVVRMQSGNFYSVLKGGFDHVLVKPYGDPKGKVSRVGILQMQLEIKNGAWTFYGAGDDSFKKLLFTPEQLEFRAQVFASIFYSKLAVAANEKMVGTGAHQKYLANVIRKANNELARKAKTDISQVYGDPAMIDNLISETDRLVTRFAKLLPYEALFLHSILDEYEADPTKFIGRKINVKQ